MPTPSSIWLMDEASGSLIDRVGSVDLAPSGSPLYERQAVGLWDGVSAFNKKAVEFDGVPERFEAASLGSFDLGAAASFAFLIVFRTIGPSGLSLMSKRLGDAPKRGYQLFGYANLGGGSGMRAQIDDGTNQDVADVVADTNDGAPHVALMVVDRNAGNIGLYTDVGQDTAAITATGSLSNSEKFLIGEGANTFLSSNPRCQLLYAAVFEGAQAEGLTQTHLDNFWKAFQDPSGKLTTYSRASLFSDIVGYDNDEPRVAHYSGLPTTPQVALGYRTPLTLGQKFQLTVWDAVTNQCVNSEDLANGWTAAAGATVTANDADAPDGFRSADRVNATGTVDFVWEHANALTASTQYTVSAWLRADSDHNVKVAATDGAGSNTEIASQSFVVTSQWQRFDFQFTTQVGQTAARIKLFPDNVNGTDSVHVWGVQVNAGGYAAPYVRTAGAVTSTVDIDARISNSNHEHLRTDKGEIDVVYHLDEDTETNQDVVGSTTTGADFREITARMSLSPDKARFIVNDGASSQVALVEANTTSEKSEENVVAQWDSAGDVLGTGFSVRLINNGNPQGGGTAFTPGSGTTSLSLGRRAGNIDLLQGGVARLRIYDRPKTQ